MSYLIPGWNLSIEDKKRLREGTVEAAIQQALYLCLAQDKRELVVEGLFPSYLGLKKWIAPEHPVDEWFTWIEHKVGSRSVIAITHVSIIFPVTPGLNLLRFSIGAEAAQTKAIFSLSQLYSVGPLLKAIEEDVSISKIAEANTEKERIDWLKSWPIMEGYFSEPVFYGPGDFVNIKLFCDSADKAGLVLGGFVIEPVGQTVSK